LFFVAEVGRTPVVKYLLEHGAKVDLVDGMGKTAIDIARGNGGGERRTASPEIVALLEGTAVSR